MVYLHPSVQPRITLLLSCHCDGAKRLKQSVPPFAGKKAKSPSFHRTIWGVVLVTMPVTPIVNLVYPLTARRFRHTFANQMLAAGMPVSSLQRYLGHEHLDTTIILVEVSDHLLCRTITRK